MSFVFPCNVILLLTVSSAEQPMGNKCIGLDLSISLLPL